jgi:hypothetical protein
MGYLDESAARRQSVDGEGRVFDGGGGGKSTRGQRALNDRSGLSVQLVLAQLLDERRALQLQ